MRHNLRMVIDERFGTQISCARAVGIHYVRLNRICRGSVEPTETERKCLSVALSADPVWLFSGAMRIPSLVRSTPEAPTSSAMTCAEREG